MSKSCDICGKKPSFGNTVSHANNRHSRRWFPNLQNVHAVVNGRPMKMSVCTGCLKAGKVTKKVRGQNKRPAATAA